MGYGTYRTGVLDGTKPTPDKIAGAVNGSMRRSFTEIYDLSKANVDKVSGTTNVVADIPAGHAIQAIHVRSTVSLTTSTLAFGVAGTPAKYGAAAAYGVTPEASKDYLNTSKKGTMLAAGERLIMTSGAADLPAVGIVVVEVVTSARG